MPKLINYKAIHFYGYTNGYPLAMQESFEVLKGKKISIKSIEKFFYTDRDTVIEAFFTNFPPTIISQLKIVRYSGLIPKDSLGWYLDGGQYFGLFVNDNLMIENNLNISNMRNILNDLILSAETDIINSIKCSMNLGHYINYANDSNAFLPKVIIKLNYEVIE